MDRFSTAILIFQSIYLSIIFVFYKALYRRRKQYDTLSRIATSLMKEKHQGQTLTKEEVKVQTAHDLGVENVSKEEA